MEKKKKSLKVEDEVSFYIRISTHFSISLFPLLRSIIGYYHLKHED